MTNQTEKQVYDEPINEMLSLFRKCAQQADELAKSITNFEDVFTKIQKSIAAIETIEQSLSGNRSIEHLLARTNEIQEIFEYFHKHIPQLSTIMHETHEKLSIQQNNLTSAFANIQEILHDAGNLSKLVEDAAYIKEMLSQVTELNIDDEVTRMEGAIKEYSGLAQLLRRDIGKQISDSVKSINTENANTSKNTADVIKNHLEESMIKFTLEISDLVGNKIDAIIKESTQSIFTKLESTFEKMNKPSISETNDVDSIYNLCLNNGMKLPIVVCRPNWHSGFRLEVERLEVIAYGKTINNQGVVNQSAKYDADKPEFILYKE